jgi:23S rRNA (pseudouridine1915-N3)-methyltransferase
MEGKLILNKLEISDYIILLDDKGKDFSSLQFSEKLTSLMHTGKKRLVFVVGGAYGVSNDIFSRCNERLSLSRMTFSHQMVRLFFVEQIYRAFTILNNEPYHHK